MNIYKTFLLLFLASILFLLNPVYATEVMVLPEKNCPEQNRMKGSGNYIFSIHDIDKNGALSKEEYQHFLEHIEHRRKSTGRPMRRFSVPLRFEEIDTNTDGYISEDEMISALNKRLQKHRLYRYKNSGR